MCSYANNNPLTFSDTTGLMLDRGGYCGVHASNPCNQSNYPGHDPDNYGNAGTGSGSLPTLDTGLAPPGGVPDTVPKTYFEYLTGIELPQWTVDAVHFFGGEESCAETVESCAGFAGSIFLNLLGGPGKKRAADELMGLFGTGAARGIDEAIVWTGRDPAYRSNLTKFLGRPPKGEYDAHHLLPVEFGRDFARRGIDANDPRFGAWVARAEHQGFSKEYSKDWAAFLRGSPTSNEILDFGRMMGGKYGFDVNY